MTKVDRIPAPQRVTFDPESHALTINIGATCLQLVRFNFTLKFSFNFNSLEKVQAKCRKIVYDSLSKHFCLIFIRNNFDHK